MRWINLRCNREFVPGEDASIRLGLKVTRLIESKPTKGVKESLKALYSETYNRYCRYSESSFVSVVDSPQLATGFRLGVVYGFITNTSAGSEVQDPSTICLLYIS